MDLRRGVGAGGEWILITLDNESEQAVFHLDDVFGLFVIWSSVKFI